MKRIFFIFILLSSFAGLGWAGDGDTATPNTDMTYNTGMTNNTSDARVGMTDHSEIPDGSIQWNQGMTTNTGMTDNTSDPRTGLTNHSEIPDVPAVPNVAKPNVDIDIFSQ